LGFIIWWADPFVATTSLFYPNHINQIVALLSVLFSLEYLRTERKSFVVMAGLAAGMGSLFKPTIAVFNLGALFLFFFARQLILAQIETQPETETVDSAPNISLAKTGIAVELGAIVVGLAIYSAMFQKLAIGFTAYIFFLLPTYLVGAYMLILGLRVLRLPSQGALLWNRFKETFSIFMLMGAGIVVWQLIQIAYFAQHGALGDFVDTYTKWSGYNTNYASPLVIGPRIIITCIAIPTIAAILYAIVKADLRDRKRILFASSALVLTAVAPMLWYASQSTLLLANIALWFFTPFFFLLACFLLVFKDTRQALGDRNASNLFGFLLITVYAAINLLDAFPRADIGHLCTVIPPFLILFGYLAQRVYDSCRTYMEHAMPRAGKVVAGAIIGMFALNIFIPSVFATGMFYFLVKPSFAEGWHILSERNFAPAPRLYATAERARGISIHAYMADLWGAYSKKDVGFFFVVVEYLSTITEKGDTVFSPTLSGLMLYFLTDTDGPSGEANLYTYQTMMGLAAGADFEDFSDRDLARVLQQRMPKAIVTKKESPEIQNFVKNCPITWNFMIHSYRLKRSIGPFDIYTPD